ncbi:hypothetical protein [Streptomyces sp. BA2]|uniref:hypothetical protein n=1 Tax=Streptomyces sp. BA2 TaxID=436595 RepID=UPI001324B2E3|nr:hypothetical protein [Streptomyces sp. BA2]MWA07669.1 hypothetical protein [Streptomyces sp. BA2]
MHPLTSKGPRPATVYRIEEPMLLPPPHLAPTSHLSPGMRRAPSCERTPWGWLRFSPAAPDGAPQHLLQIGIRTPDPSLRARCAQRWLTRRPPLRLYFDHGGSVTALTLMTALVALLGMSWAIDHGLPAVIGLPLAILLPLLVDHLPARLDTRARAYARIIDTGPGLDYLQRLTAQHARLVRAHSSRPGPELGCAAELGHRTLWEIAVIITAPDRSPDITCRWLALESLMDHLAREADDIKHQRALDGPAAADDDSPPAYRAPGHP